MKNELERRSYNFDVNSEQTEEGAILTGRPVVYNSRTDLGWFDEIIEPGALDKTDLTDVRFLVNHDVSKIPLARSRGNNGNSTMQLSVDSEGLKLDWVKLDVENNSEARALYSAVERNDLSGMSFMFSVNRDEWEDIETDHPLRRIKEIGSIVEISAVTFPAYSAANISSRSKEALENARLELENARRRDANGAEALELAKAKFKFKSKTGGNKK